MDDEHAPQHIVNIFIRFAVFFYYFASLRVGCSLLPSLLVLSRSLTLLMHIAIDECSCSAYVSAHIVYISCIML